MIPMLHSAHIAALNDASELTNQAECLRTEQCWTELFFTGSLEAVECTTKGLLLTPADGDPSELFDQLSARFELSFTREKDDSGLYQWVTTWPTMGNFQVYILVNENIDMTGTIVTNKAHS